jgi:4-alpha-glucanotransferase
LAAARGRAAVVSRPRLAGVSIPLFSLRSQPDWGIGGIDDLAPFAEWAVSAGQRVIALLPLGELGADEASPYNALSSFALDPLYLSPESIEELRGAAVNPPATIRSAKVNRERARAWKEPLFDEAFRRFRALPVRHSRRRRLHELRRRASWLADYSLFRALLEEQGGRSWKDWPAPLRRRDPRALAAARRRLDERILRYEYLQLAADEAWRDARRAVARRGVLLMGDLPFAPSENSADVWANPELFDLSRSAGAPPDAFSATGQRWGLPMYRWQEMRRSGWSWFRRRVRRMAELYDIFRVDHVVGLFRTFGFVGESPSGFDPAEETAQIEQGREVLSIVLEEARPAAPVAEDLGVIPEFVTEALTALDVPGYRVLRWVRDGDRFIDPREYPECSIATTGTHDTEALAAWWDELPRDERRALVEMLGLGKGTARGELTRKLHRSILARLYASPSRLVILPMQDLFGWRERVNTPATIDSGNWCYRLPFSTAELAARSALAAESEQLRALIDASRRLRTMDASSAGAPDLRETREPEDQE